MRSFEQRMAEIHRRSEKIFKARARRRKRILLACIPLTLCAGIFCAAILPGVVPVRLQDPGPVDGLTEAVGESLASSVAEIQVSGPDISVFYTEAADILRISGTLEAFKAAEPEIGEIEGILGAISQEDATDVNGYSSVITGQSMASYTVTLVMRGGGTAEYCLAGNLLKDLSTGQAYTLTQAQMNELKDLLGIPFR